MQKLDAALIKAQERYAAQVSDTTMLIVVQMLIT